MLVVIVSLIQSGMDYKQSGQNCQSPQKNPAHLGIHDKAIEYHISFCNVN